MAAGRTAPVVAAAPVEIMTYDANGDCRCRRCPRGAVTADMMMTMVGKRGGKVSVRQQQDDDEAMVRQLQDKDEATRMRRQLAMVPQVAGATRQSTRG
jgi:hypothetical protein